MCLTISQYFKTRQQARDFSKQPLIAKKDIVVYKVINIFGGASIYRNFKYEQGYHYYQTGKRPFGFVIYKGSFQEKWKIDINEGLHSYSTVTKATSRCDSYSKVVEMIIPKGAKYFIGSNNDIVLLQCLLDMFCFQYPLIRY